jgi:hypothetical protein
MADREPLLINDDLNDREALSSQLRRRRRDGRQAPNKTIDNQTKLYRETHDAEDIDAATASSISGGLSWCNNGAGMFFSKKPFTCRISAH